MAQWDHYTLDVRALQCRNAPAVAELLAAATSAARQVEYQLGAGGGHADDVAQELVMWVLDTFLGKYEEGRTVYPLLLVVAKRSLLNRRRATWREIDSSKFGDDQEAITHVLDAILAEQDEGVADAATHCAAEETAAIRQRIADTARSKLRQQMLNACCRAAAPPAAAVEAKPEVRTTREKDPLKFERACRPEVQELIHIRKQLQMTQRQFSELLNVAPGHINTLEQGTIVGEPRHLLEIARRRVTESGMRTAVTTQEIVAKMKTWCAALQLTADDMAGLAMFLGVNRSTVHRWKKGDYVPKREQVERIEAQIAEVART